MVEIIRIKQKKTGEGVMQGECMAEVQELGCKKTELHNGNVAGHERGILS